MSSTPKRVGCKSLRARRTLTPVIDHLESRLMLSTMASSSEPTADEQYMLQLINRVRANPAAEAQRLLAISQSDPIIRSAMNGWDASAFLQEMNSHGPLPPLAFNPRLIAASRAHDDAMVDANAQFHSVSGSLARPTTPSQLAPDGQPYFLSNDSSWATAENVFAYSGNLSNPHGQALDDYFHEAFLLDWGNPDFGHLRNLMLPGPSGAAAAGTYPMSEIGIGIVTDAHPTTPPTANPAMPVNRGLDVGPALVTEEFGWRSGHEFLTGAIYSDRNANGFYTPGEGLGGVTITTIGLHGEGSFTTQTWESGGYSLDLPSGTYQVTASGGGLTSPSTKTITIGQDNIGWDVAMSDPSHTPIVSNPPIVTTSTTHPTDIAPPIKQASKPNQISKPHKVRHPKPPKWHRHH